MKKMFYICDRKLKAGILPEKGFHHFRESTI